MQPNNYSSYIIYPISQVCSILVLEWLGFLSPIGAFNIVQYSNEGLLIGPQQYIEGAAA